MTTKQEKIIEKMARAQKPAVGDGSKAFKSLTAAVRAAEREKKEAVEAMVMAKSFAVRASDSLVQMEAAQVAYEWKLRSMQTRCRACSWVSMGAAIVAWVFFILSF